MAIPFWSFHCNQETALQRTPHLHPKGYTNTKEKRRYSGRGIRTWSYVGDISDQSSVDNRKQERRARLIAYEIRFPLIGIVDAYKAHCTNAYEVSEYLEVSEDTIIEALEYYRQIYGCKSTVGNYIIQFEPCLQVGEIFKI